MHAGNNEIIDFQFYWYEKNWSNIEMFVLMFIIDNGWVLKSNGDYIIAVNTPNWVIELLLDVNAVSQKAKDNNSIYVVTQNNESLATLFSLPHDILHKEITQHLYSSNFSLLVGEMQEQHLWHSVCIIQTMATNIPICPFSFDDISIDIVQEFKKINCKIRAFIRRLIYYTLAGKDVCTIINTEDVLKKRKQYDVIINGINCDEYKYKKALTNSGHIMKYSYRHIYSPFEKYFVKRQIQEILSVNGIPLAIISPFKENDHINMTSLPQGEYDISSFQELYDNLELDDDYTTTVNYDDIGSYDNIKLNPQYYIGERIPIRDGYKIISLDQVLIPTFTHKDLVNFEEDIKRKGRFRFDRSILDREHSEFDIPLIGNEIFRNQRKIYINLRKRELVINGVICIIGIYSLQNSFIIDTNGEYVGIWDKVKAYNVNTGLINPRYLLTELNQPYVRKQIENLSITPDSLYRVNIYVPDTDNSIVEQEHIFKQRLSEHHTELLKREGVTVDPTGCLCEGALIGDRYRIAKPIDSGGFAKTYQAYDIRSPFGKKIVAIKELFIPDMCSRIPLDTKLYINEKDKSEFKKYKEMFLSEVDVVKSIYKSCEYVPRLMSDAIDDNNTLYYAMTYVDKGTLFENITNVQDGLPLSSILDVILKIGIAINTMHMNDKAHMDVTPGNIMFYGSEMKPILVDFGNSKAYDRELHTVLNKTRLATTGHYASPEQIHRYEVKTIDMIKCDVYSLAACMYFMLTRSHPTSEGFSMIEQKKLKEANVPEDLCKSLKNAMSINPNNRPMTIKDFLISMSKRYSQDDMAIINSLPQPGNKLRVISMNESTKTWKKDESQMSTL